MILAIDVKVVRRGVLGDEGEKEVAASGWIGGWLERKKEKEKKNWNPEASPGRR